MRRVIPVSSHFSSSWLVALILALALVSCWKVEADLVVSATEINFGESKESSVFTVRNDSEDNALTSGVVTLEYQMKADKPWLNVTPTKGVCGSMEKIAHTVTVDRSLMAYGTNTGTISVTSNGGSATILVRATRLVPGCSTAPTEPHTPSPVPGATGVVTLPELSWEGGTSLCDSLTATYDVYFGDTTPPPFHHNNGSLRVWSPGALTNNTIYYWRIVAKDANGATSGSEWWFRTFCSAGPGDVTLLEPANNATDVSVITDLTWRGGAVRCAGLTTTYDLYFGTTSPPPFHHSTLDNSWYAGVLSRSTTYYWKVVAKDANGTSTSEERKFTTVANPCTTPPTAVSPLSPAQGAADVPLDQDLSWSGGDSQCDGASATYDVYFGTQTPPPLHHNNGTAKSWDPGPLEYNTIYYWRIVARDVGGSVTTSEQWFRTPCRRAPGVLTLVSPANGATGVSVDADLLWGGGNSLCPGLTSTYDVYFGTTSSPPFHHNNGSVKYWDPGTLTVGTRYYWKIIAKDAHGVTEGPVWDFTTVCTTGPGAVSLVSPADGATGVAISADMSWTGGNSQCPGLTATYDVYFGKTSPPPFDHNNGSTKTWDPGVLDYSTTYHWRIVAKDANGSVSSAERSFTTGVEPCVLGPGAVTIVSPSNGATGVANDADLSWSGGNSQCPGLTATYAVYFGTTNPPPFDHNNGTVKSWDPGPLDYSATYYWRIVSQDANGETTGPVWSFTTEAPCLSAPTAPCTPNPSNGRTGVNENTNLAWLCGDSQCGLTVTYDVYFGTTEALGEGDKLGSTIDKAWSLPRLARQQTTYYWKIVARDTNGTTSSPVWSFTTRN